ncbi:MAG: thermonuclease family protein, partial [Gammaproteobacteria bacterium]
NRLLPTLLNLLLAIGLPCSSALAEVYQWQDASGKTHFADRPHSGADIVALKPDYSYYQVKSVYDGDTVQLADGRKIRLLGINTPEIESRYKTGEPGGLEAKRWLHDALQNEAVRLITDVETRDKYGRTLAHLFTRANRHLNLELVEAGLASVTIHPPNLLYADRLTTAQINAEAAGKGLWGLPEYAPLPVERLTAGNYKGWRRIVGHCTGVRETRKNVYLKFTDRFEAGIAKTLLPLFPPPQSYSNQTLELRGWLHRSKDRFSMSILHPSAIKIISDTDR